MLPWEKRTFIIAEIGKNFIQTQDERPVAEYLENAKKLVKLAKESGADAVKFQTHNVDDEQLNIHAVSPHFKGADRYAWISRNTNATPLATFWKPLSDYCKEIGITFFSTPMSRGAAQKLQQLHVELWKIGSGDILDFLTLDYIATTKKPLIISSGMSTLEELDLMVSFLRRRNVQFALLHCVSKYPCPPEELNLASMDFLKERYKIPIGFSDHSIGHESAVAAVALGAHVIEKHFSLSRDLWGADHKVSMTPEEFKTMVHAIREIEAHPEKKQHVPTKKYLGQPGKMLQEGEAVFRGYFRKSLMAAKDLHAGTVLHPEHLYAMRPQAFAGGLPSEQYEKILGKKLTKPVRRFGPITADMLQ